MRRPIIAGNWKMNLSREESVALARVLVEKAGAEDKIDLAVCPPHVYLDAVSGVVADSKIGLGAQNMYHEPDGAFTGEHSAAMLLDVGCRYVILGHSERRHVFRETNADVNEKVKAALKAGLVPIVCVGETLEQREANETFDVIQEQFDGSLAGISAEQMIGIVIAYEPVWAIGTGRTASPEQAAAVHKDLRGILKDRFNADVAEAVRIQYGGSVKPTNAAELLEKKDIDGALVGGASLVADDFLKIIAAAKNNDQAS